MNPYLYPHPYIYGHFCLKPSLCVCACVCIYAYILYDKPCKQNNKLFVCVHVCMCECVRMRVCMYPHKHFSGKTVIEY